MRFHPVPQDPRRFLRWILPVALGLLLVGCQGDPSGQAWNRPTKAEISGGWIRVGNPEVDQHRQESPYP